MPDSTDTRDLLDLMRLARDKTLPGENPDDPEATEDQARRRGDLHLRLGLSFLALTFVVALGVIAVDPTPFRRDPVLFSFALLATITLLLGAVILVCAGMAEKIVRPQRTLARRAARFAPENARRIDDLTVILAEMREQLNRQNEALAKIEKVIEKVPQYPEAVLDGFDLGRVVTGNERRP